jgi:hypothetical protein
MASQLSFTGFAWKNLWRRRLRTLLTLGGIAMAIGAFVALVGYARAFEHEWLRMYEGAGTDLAVVEKSFLNTSLDEAVGAKLQALPLVEQARPMIFNLMDLTPEVNALVFGWQADSYELDSLNLTSGKRFQDGKPEIMLGDILAGTLKKNVGDTMEIQGWRPARSLCPSINCNGSPACKGRLRHFMCGCARRLPAKTMPATSSALRPRSKPLYPVCMPFPRSSARPIISS